MARQIAILHEKDDPWVGKLYSASSSWAGKRHVQIEGLPTLENYVHYPTLWKLSTKRNSAPHQITLVRYMPSNNQNGFCHFIGCLRINLQKSPLKFAEVTNLYIHEEARKKGHAKVMYTDQMKGVLALARHYGKFGIRVNIDKTNRASLELHKALDFALDEEEIDDGFLWYQKIITARP